MNLGLPSTLHSASGQMRPMSTFLVTSNQAISEKTELLYAYTYDVHNYKTFSASNSAIMCHSLVNEEPNSIYFSKFLVTKLDKMVCFCSGCKKIKLVENGNISTLERCYCENTECICREYRCLNRNLPIIKKIKL